MVRLGEKLIAQRFFKVVIVNLVSRLRFEQITRLRRRSSVQDVKNNASLPFPATSHYEINGEHAVVGAKDENGLTRVDLLAGQVKRLLVAQKRQ